MRVITTTTARAPRVSEPARHARRLANVEMLGLLAGSLVILLGLGLTYWGRLGQLSADERNGRLINLQRLRGPEELVPLLGTFESTDEQRTIARALYRRTLDRPSKIDHVGALAAVRLPASDVKADRKLVRLRERLAQRPDAEDVAVLTPADIADIKPRLAVRTVGEFGARVLGAAAWFFGAFWIAHLVRRWRRAADDPLLLPAVLMLSGIGLISMLALRDPLRDTVAASTFAWGVAGGLGLLLAASEIDFEASRLRRSVLAPLSLALGLAALLLILGTGPGASGVKVNLFGFQPVEVIRLLVVFALAAHFAGRLEFLREFSEQPAPAHPWLRHIRVPRWKDIRPVIISMSLVLAFFFLQKDLGPALVLSCVFMALYAIARGRVPAVIVGFALLAAGFAFAYWIGYPSTVRQRVMIWADPWNNGVPGGNQIAHGLWALSTGAFWGSGPGLGSPASVPAGHTDFVLAAIGEELGFLGLAVVIGLYAILSWRCFRTALRAPGDFSALLATGVALVLVVQAFVIGSGMLALVPLSGVVTPFLSYGRSSMLANCLAIGIVLAIAKRNGPLRPHLHQPMRGLAMALSLAALAVIGRAAWVQIARADRFATASSLSEQADGGNRFEYNPRLVAASHTIQRGTIFDRNGLPLATSAPERMATITAEFRKQGIVPAQGCPDAAERCYPLGGPGFSLVGDWNERTNWGARNSSYYERDSDATLKGYDDRQLVVDVINRRTGTNVRTIRRDYSELLPLVRHRNDPTHPAVKRLLDRPRDLRTSIDARLQTRVAAALEAGVETGGHSRGAAIVLDVESGEVLASVSYPWPTGTRLPDPSEKGRDRDDPLLDRARYGLYAPGSTFKLLVAAAALRTGSSAADSTFQCVRLPGGRVGNFVRGWSRPVRDDLLDTSPHGVVGLRRGLVVSCNAYFAQLAIRLGSRPIFDAASPFQIQVARQSTPASLQRTLPHAGYGQAEVLVSPLKMARVAAAIARGGLIVPLQWLAAPEVTDEQPQRFLSEEDASVLSGYMRDAVTHGTGRALAPNPTPIAGKTGTAEVAGGKSHSWFVGFAPFDGPRRIAFAVLVENAGYGGRAAAPIAGEVVNAARELGLFQARRSK
ncbi:MAG TPA: FtsW/RodA/SpoVE family cell cycle protein [Vicinamibacterales bacterium]|nr:FtsW/RodA/SpoVE family cell cycle protein [Vicinamibacterales bacterium]